MNEQTNLFNETQPMKNSGSEDYMLSEEDEFPVINTHSTYMKIAIKYKLPPDLKSIFKISKIGNSYGFCPDINGDPSLLLGPHWPYFLISFSISTIMFIILHKSYINLSQSILSYFGWPIYFFWAISYIITSVKNPGYPKTNLESIRGSKQMSYCDKCELWNKPKSNTYHCNRCDICIEGHKFHFIFTGHCIGKNNKKEFYIFISATFFLIIYLTVVYYLSKRIRNNENIEIIKL